MRPINYLIAGIICVFLVSGCSISRPRPASITEPAAMAEAKQLLEEQKEQKEGDRPGAPPLEEKLEPYAAGLEKETELFSLVFQGAALGDVLNALTKDSDYNLIVESGVDLSRQVTVNLKSVTFEEALDTVVTRSAGYAWTLKNHFLNIRRFEERIYHFDYLDIIGEASVEVGGDMLASSVETSGVSGKFQIKAQRSSENSDVWSSVQAALEGLKSEDGKLRINRNSGVIFMSDTPQRISEMVRFLDSLSDALHRQVFLEAKIVEVQLSDDSRYGIDWTKLDLTFRGGESILPDQFNLSVNGGGTIVLGESTSFSTVLDFLRTQGDVSVLSNPHIAVMNGQSALMTVGYQFPYGDISGVSRDEQSDTVTVDATIKRAILGLQLGITARISGDGMVTLNIVPTVTRIQSDQKVELPTSATTVQAISNPVIDLQELATTVRVKEGRSIVLAGLISQVTQLEEEGLPVLGNLPVIGSLFRHAEESRETKELVIFITPKIMAQD
jgi:MSHA type pilus biogenesis protein MshL